jgi:hypothetical protein
MGIAVGLWKAGPARLSLTPVWVGKRSHARLFASVLAAAFAMAVAGCAADQGRTASKVLTERAPNLSRTAKLSRAPKVSRAARVFRSGTGPSIGAGSIPLPDQALLEPQPEPQCEFKAQPADPSDLNAQRVMKLDYERQCYRHAEIIVRNRLHLLQASVGKASDAAKRSEQSSR